MTLNDWILSLHVLSAFALVAAMILFWVVILAFRATPGDNTGLGRLAQLGGIAVGAGTTGTLIFGIWLAISLDAYQLWDGWVIAGLVLWAIGTGMGQQAGKLAAEPGNLDRAVLLQAISSAAVLLVLIDMIWKPGA